MTKEFYDKVYKAGHASEYDGGENGMPERVAILWSQTAAWLREIGLEEKKHAKILEIGSGMSFLSHIHSGWHGAEYSKSAVERVRAREGSSVKIFEEDAQKLSFTDEYFDAVFSFAALEHVPDPDKAFREIDRVLKVGGFGLIAPAWNCRSWTVKKIQQRPFSKLSLFEKIEIFTIPFREHIVFRGLMVLPKRLFAELLSLFGSKPLPLRFKVLHPRWDLIEEYGHVSDDDAVANIDPHAAITFFRTRGYRISSHQTILDRLLARHEPVLVQKVGD